MSGASALASARRRRAEPTPQTNQQLQNRSVINKEIKTDESNVNQTATPLQILQLHDKKIKELDNNLESIILEVSKKVFSENIKHLNLDKVVESKKEVVEFDSTPILEKINSLSSNFDELKTLVIKSQQTTNESSNEMLKIKDKVLELEKHINKIESDLKEYQESDENIFNMDQSNSAEVLLRNMMKSSVIENLQEETLNIHESNSDNDSNDIGEINEITLTQSDLNELKSEVVNELIEENINQYNVKSDTLIDVSENEDE